MAAINYVTVVQKSTGQECLVERQVEWEKAIVLTGEILSPGDHVVITLQNGGVATLIYSKRAVVWFKRTTERVTVYGGSFVTEMEIKLRWAIKPQRLLSLEVIPPLIAGLVLLSYGLPMFLHRMGRGVLAWLMGLIGPAEWMQSLDQLLASAAETSGVSQTTPFIVPCLALLLACYSLSDGVTLGYARMVTWELTFPRPKVERDYLSSGDQKNTIPKRYIDSCFGNVAEAYRLWYETCRWRADLNVADILEKPPLNPAEFLKIKRNCGHFFAGKVDVRSPSDGNGVATVGSSVSDSHLVLYLRPGTLDLERLKQDGLTTEHLKKHMIFLLEYIFTLLDPSEDARVILLLDIRDVTFKQVSSGETFEFWRKMVFRLPPASRPTPRRASSEPHTLGCHCCRCGSARTTTQNAVRRASFSTFPPSSPSSTRSYGPL